MNTNFSMEATNREQEVCQLEVQPKYCFHSLVFFLFSTILPNCRPVMFFVNLYHYQTTWLKTVIGVLLSTVKIWGSSQPDSDLGPLSLGSFNSWKVFKRVILTLVSKSRGCIFWAQTEGVFGKIKYISIVWKKGGKLLLVQAILENWSACWHHCSQFPFNILPQQYHRHHSQRSPNSPKGHGWVDCFISNQWIYQKDATFTAILQANISMKASE